MATQISKVSFNFLKDLSKNNNRDWFNERKPIFKEHEKEAKAFFATIHERLEENDQIEAHKVYRIYNDIRFSKNKLPYKSRFAGSFSRATAARRGGYFLNIEPGNCLAGGGFYAPNKEDLLRIREEFAYDDTEIRAIINDPKFKETFGTIAGDEVKTAPRGFDPTHPAIDLIKKKQFFFVTHFTDAEVLKSDFLDKIMDTYNTVRPFFDYMSNVLTTDMNGESIIGE